MDYKEQLSNAVKALIAQDAETARENIKQVIIAKSQNFMNGDDTRLASTTVQETDAE